MTEPKYPGLPFLTRDMLSFEHGAALSLKIVVQSSSVIDLQIKGITREGSFTFVHTTLGTGVIETETFSIPDFPIMVSVLDPTSALVFGSVYASLQVVLNGEVIYQLCSGLVYSQKALSYPAQNQTDARPGGGRMRIITVTVPSAGAEFTTTVPAGSIWRFVGLRFLLTTNSTVANRRVHLKFSPSATDMLDCFASIDHAESLARQYSCSPYGAVPDETDDNDIIITTPGSLILVQADRVRSETLNIQTGDAFTAIKMLVEEWFNAP